MSKKWLVMFLSSLWLVPLNDVAALSRQAPAATVHASINVDLSQIGHIAPKGRVQDKEYNPNVPTVDALIEAGPDVIPFLVSKLEDETEIKGHIFDYWPKVCVGDVAFVILVDFFTTPDWRHSTVPGFDSREILECLNDDIPSSSEYDHFITAHGRRALRRKVESLLKPYNGRFVWDPEMQCFFPEKEKSKKIYAHPMKWAWPKVIRVKTVFKPSQGPGDYVAIIEVGNRKRIVKEGQRFEGLEVAFVDGLRKCVLLRTTELQQQEEKEFCLEERDDP